MRSSRSAGPTRPGRRSKQLARDFPDDSRIKDRLVQINDDLLARPVANGGVARVHIVFRLIGIAMPVLIGGRGRVADYRGRDLLDLAKRWARGTATCSRWAPCRARCCRSSWASCGRASWARGPGIGMPFSLEGFAFSPRRISSVSICTAGEGFAAHISSPRAVAVSGRRRGSSVVIANAWYDAPTGFALVDGRPGDIDPIAAMLNPAAFPQACT